MAAAPPRLLILLDRHEAVGVGVVIGRQPQAAGFRIGAAARLPAVEQPARRFQDFACRLDMEKGSIDVAANLIDDLPRDRLD